jgi:hypothetical protein
MSNFIVDYQKKVLHSSFLAALTLFSIGFVSAVLIYLKLTLSPHYQWVGGLLCAAVGYISVLVLTRKMHLDIMTVGDWRDFGEILALSMLIEIIIFAVFHYLIRSSLPSMFAILNTLPFYLIANVVCLLFNRVIIRDHPC